MLRYLKKWHQLDKVNRFRFLAMIFMQVAFVGALLISIYEKNWLNGFIVIAGLFVIWIPSVVEKNFRIHFPLEFGFLLNLFIYASIFLGELRGYYTRFWWWDIVLHAGSGVALGFIGFLILYSFYRSEKLKIEPWLLAVFSFSFALALGALWEIFEFSMDSIFGFNMQKPMLGDSTGLVDTMWDLIVDAIGAFVVSLSGYFYIKQKGKKPGLFQKYTKIYFSENESLVDN